jgi:hypothetical protein
MKESHPDNGRIQDLHFRLSILKSKLAVLETSNPNYVSALIEAERIENEIAGVLAIGGTFYDAMKGL